MWGGMWGDGPRFAEVRRGPPRSAEVRRGSLRFAEIRLVAAAERDGRQLGEGVGDGGHHRGGDARGERRPLLEGQVAQVVKEEGLEVGEQEVAAAVLARARRPAEAMDVLRPVRRHAHLGDTWRGSGDGGVARACVDGVCGWRVWRACVVGVAWTCRGLCDLSVG